MNCNQFNAALAKLQFTQVDFARAIGKTDRAVRNWSAGRWPVPKEIGLLLELMDALSAKQWKKVSKKLLQTK